MGLNLTAGKFKNLKAIAHHLWNISKYFGKLTKQLEVKQKKGAAGGKGAIIRNFLQSYETYKAPHMLLDWKNPGRAEKEVVELKQKVSNLKNQIQGE
jgi:glycerate kinase